MKSFFVFISLLFSFVFSQLSVFGVSSTSKISDTTGGFTFQLSDEDMFGSSTTSVGDLDGNIFSDIVVGARNAAGTGAAFVVFLGQLGTAIGFQEISNSAGNLGQTLENGEAFGFAISSLGDINDDGIPDIIVGSPLRNSMGAAYTLLLNADGTVNASTLIAPGSGGFVGPLDNGDEFGFAVSNIGDLNQDGLTDAAISALLDDDGSTDAGAIYIVFLDGIGAVTSEQKISSTVGGNFNAPFTMNLRFGHFIALIGDVNGDNSTEIGVGAPNDDDGGMNRGSMYILFLTVNGTASLSQKISNTQGSFFDTLDDDDNFGMGGTGLGDVNMDGIPDLAVSAPFDDDGGLNRGAFYTLFLNSDGTVFSSQKISEGSGGFSTMLDDDDQFGWSLGNLGDFNADGTTDILVGTRNDDDGGQNRGAVYILDTTYANCPSICLPTAISPLTTNPVVDTGDIEENADDDGLSTAEIAGIVVGIFLFCLIVVGIASACLFEYLRNSSQKEQPDTDHLFYNSTLRASLPNKTPNLANYVEEKRKSQMPQNEGTSTSSDDDDDDDDDDDKESSSSLEEANKKIKQLKKENKKLKKELSSKSSTSDSSSD